MALLFALGCHASQGKSPSATPAAPTAAVHVPRDDGPDPCAALPEEGDVCAHTMSCPVPDEPLSRLECNGRRWVEVEVTPRDEEQW